MALEFHLLLNIYTNKCPPSLLLHKLNCVNIYSTPIPSNASPYLLQGEGYAEYYYDNVTVWHVGHTKRLLRSWYLLQV